MCTHALSVIKGQRACMLVMQGYNLVQANYVGVMCGVEC